MSLAVTLVAEALRMAAPYAAAALAGSLSERAGVVHIGLEGVLLGSGLAAVSVGIATGSPALGLVAALVVGALLSLGHALFVEALGVDAIVSGMALNLMCFAGTRLVLRGLYDSASNSPSVGALTLLPEGGARGAGGLLLRALADPVSLAIVAAALLLPLALEHTRFGLRVRAVGEAPAAARAAGVDVPKTRVVAVTLAGALAALGGAHLAFDQHRFEAGMSAGRGFVALAAVVLAGRRPGRAALACLGFGALEAVSVVLQDVAALRKAADVAQMLPYLITLVALAVVALRARRAGAGAPG